MREQEFPPPQSESSDSDDIEAELSRLEEQAVSSDDDEQNQESGFNSSKGKENL